MVYLSVVLFNKYIFNYIGTMLNTYTNSYKWLITLQCNSLKFKLLIYLQSFFFIVILLILI